jgi:hypothetical protein
METRHIVLMRLGLPMLLALLVALTQTGCGYVAAGAAGAAVGHEIAERKHEDDSSD